MTSASEMPSNDSCRATRQFPNLPGCRVGRLSRAPPSVGSLELWEILDNPAGLLRYWLEEQYGGYPTKGEALVDATCDLLEVERGGLEGNMATLRLGVRLSELCGQVRRDVAELPEHLHPQLLLADLNTWTRFCTATSAILTSTRRRAPTSSPRYVN